MTKLERMVLKKICRSLVIQGEHKVNITQLYQIIYEATEEEFTEDNRPTLEAFLDECFADGKERARNSIPV